MTDFSFERGAFLLAKLNEAHDALNELPKSKRRDEEIAKLDDARRSIFHRLSETPHGLVHGIISQLSRAGKFRPPDTTPLHQRKEFNRLVETYGEPESNLTELTVDVLEDILKCAYVDLFSWEYVQRLCADKLICNEELPQALKLFAGIALTIPPPKKKQGRTKHSNELRDLVIVNAAALLQSQHSMQLTRGVTSTSESVCSVVAEVMSKYGLTMTEDAVRKVIEKSSLQEKK